VREWAVEALNPNGKKVRITRPHYGEPFTEETARDYLATLYPEQLGQIVYRNVDEWRPPRVKGPVHGTTGAYTNHGCRCDPCMEAWNQYQHGIRQRRKQAGLPADSTIHGTSNGYINYGCRCDPCRAAHNTSHREFRRRQRADVRAKLAAAVTILEEADDGNDPTGFRRDAAGLASDLLQQVLDETEGQKV
jgi:hypothetical protein